MKKAFVFTLLLPLLYSCNNDIPNEKYIEDISKVLRKGYPILAASTGYVVDSNNVSDDANHIYIIDYYVQKIQTITEFWAYRYEKEGEFLFDYSVFFDENTTKEDIEKYYKDGPVTEKTSEYRSFYVKMNWGWGGYCDDVLVNIDALVWTLKSTSKTYYYDHPEIVYPESVEL